MSLIRTWEGDRPSSRCNHVPESVDESFHLSGTSVNQGLSAPLLNTARRKFYSSLETSLPADSSQSSEPSM